MNRGYNYTKGVRLFVLYDVAYLFGEVNTINQTLALCQYVTNDLRTNECNMSE